MQWIWRQREITTVVRPWWSRSYPFFFDGFFSILLRMLFFWDIRFCYVKSLGARTDYSIPRFLRSSSSFLFVEHDTKLRCSSDSFTALHVITVGIMYCTSCCYGNFCTVPAVGHLIRISHLQPTICCEMFWLCLLNLRTKQEILSWGNQRCYLWEVTN